MAWPERSANPKGQLGKLSKRGIGEPVYSPSPTYTESELNDIMAGFGPGALESHAETGCRVVPITDEKAAMAAAQAHIWLLAHRTGNER